MPIDITFKNDKIYYSQICFVDLKDNLKEETIKRSVTDNLADFVYDYEDDYDSNFKNYSD